MTSTPKIQSEADLRAAIEHLKMQRIQEGDALRTHVSDTLDSVKPINLIRDTVRDIAASQELKNGIVTTAVALAAGYFIKALFQGRSKNGFRNVVGSAAQMTVTSMIANHPEAVKAAGQKVFSLVGLDSETGS
jgi:hypothetical protein